MCTRISPNTKSDSHTFSRIFHATESIYGKQNSEDEDNIECDVDAIKLNEPHLWMFDTDIEHNARNTTCGDTL